MEKLKLKWTVAVLITAVLLTAFIVPAHAQPFGEPQFPGDYYYMDGPMGPLGGSMGPFGMPMPFMSPFAGMAGRQADRVTAITRLPDPGGYGKDVAATISDMPDLSLYSAALRAAGYGQMLAGKGNYYVFAPSDKAITRDFSVKDARSLISDMALVKGLVESSIVYQPAGGQHSGEKSFVALNGKEVRMLRSRTGTTANGADVLNYVSASNGMVIVTDGAVGA